MSNPTQPLKNERGVALLIAMFAMMLLTFIAIEVSYDTTVDYVVASQQVNRIKAYYAAKAGIEISLLRIMLYKQAISAFGDQLPPDMKSKLDIIWSFPFVWPPAGLNTNSGPGGATSVEKNMIDKVVKESLMGATYATTIVPEGGRLDINDLGSPVKALKKAMIQQVTKVFLSEVEHNEKFAEKYRGSRFDELVHNIADYIDDDKVAELGGDESSPYRDKEDKEIELPPNRPLRTIDELHQVGGMTDEFYNLLAPRVTVYGSKGVNVNYADKDTLMSLDPSMTEIAVQKIIEKRSDPKQGPFTDDKNFFSFISGYGVNARAIEESKVPLLYDMEFNFRITSTGLAGNVKKEITAITYDFANLSPRYAEMMDKQDQSTAGGAGGTGGTGGAGGTGGTGGTGTGGTGGTTTPPKKKIQGAKGRPPVVYWEEN